MVIQNINYSVVGVRVNRKETVTWRVPWRVECLFRDGTIVVNGKWEYWRRTPMIIAYFEYMDGTNEDRFIKMIRNLVAAGPFTFSTDSGSYTVSGRKLVKDIIQGCVSFEIAWGKYRARSDTIH